MAEIYAKIQKIKWRIEIAFVLEITPNGNIFSVRHLLGNLGKQVLRSSVDCEYVIFVF